MYIVNVKYKNSFLNSVELLAHKVKNVCKYLQPGTYFRFEKYLKNFQKYFFFKNLNSARPCAAVRCVQRVKKQPYG